MDGGGYHGEERVDHRQGDIDNTSLKRGKKRDDQKAVHPQNVVEESLSPNELRNEVDCDQCKHLGQP